MNPSLKRRRPSFHDSDELLNYRRARNNQRLKSRFESIFKRFGRDFSDVGDEIDLETGEIVVNNGHIVSMRDEHDIHGVGNDNDKLGDIRVSDNPSVGAGISKSSGLLSKSLPTLQTSEVAPELHDLSGHDQLHELDDLTIDPKWRVPFIPSLESRRLHEFSPESLLDGIENRSHRSQSPLGQSLWAPSGTSYAATFWARGRTSSLSNLDMKRIWTIEEEALLRHLKITTNLNSTEMQIHFRGRTSTAIRSHWKKMTLAGERVKVRERRNMGPKLHWTNDEEDLLHHMKTNTKLSLQEMAEKLPGRSIASIMRHWRVLSKIDTGRGQSVRQEIRSLLDERRTTSSEVPHPKSHRISPPAEVLSDNTAAQLSSEKEGPERQRPSSATGQKLHNLKTRSPIASRLPLEGLVSSTPRNPEILRVVIEGRPQNLEPTMLTSPTEKIHPSIETQSPGDSAEDLGQTRLLTTERSLRRSSSLIHHSNSVLPQTLTKISSSSTSRRSRLKKSNTKASRLIAILSADKHFLSRLSPDVLSSSPTNPVVGKLPVSTTATSNTDLQTLNRRKCLMRLNSRVPSSSPDLPPRDPDTFSSPKATLILSSSEAVHPVQQGQSLPHFKKKSRAPTTTTSKSTPNLRRDQLDGNVRIPPISQSAPRIEGPQDRAKLYPKKRRMMSVSFSSATVGSNLRDCSDDELSLPASRFSTASIPGAPQTKTSTSTPSRRCGLPGLKCERMVCLRCI